MAALRALPGAEPHQAQPASTSPELAQILAMASAGSSGQSLEAQLQALGAATATALAQLAANQETARLEEMARLEADAALADVAVQAGRLAAAAALAAQEEAAKEAKAGPPARRGRRNDRAAEGPYTERSRSVTKVPRGSGSDSEV